MGLNTFTPQPSTIGFSPARLPGIRDSTDFSPARKRADFAVQLQDLRRQYQPSEQGPLPVDDRHHGRRILQPATPQYRALTIGRKAINLLHDSSWESTNSSRVDYAHSELQRELRIFSPRNWSEHREQMIERITFTPSNFFRGQPERNRIVLLPISGRLSAGCRSTSGRGLTTIA